MGQHTHDQTAITTLNIHLLKQWAHLKVFQSCLRNVESLLWLNLDHVTFLWTPLETTFVAVTCFMETQWYNSHTLWSFIYCSDHECTAAATRELTVLSHNPERAILTNDHREPHSHTLHYLIRPGTAPTIYLDVNSHKEFTLQEWFQGTLFNRSANVCASCCNRPRLVSRKSAVLQHLHHEFVM